MVKRFVSPEQGQQGTVSFQVFTLEWDGETTRWESSSPSSAALIRKMLFVGRGCSRAIRTGRSGPAFIYFLDDADGFPEELLSIIVSTDKEYRCSDIGWCRYDLQAAVHWKELAQRAPGKLLAMDLALPLIASSLLYVGISILLEQILSDAM